MSVRLTVGAVRTPAPEMPPVPPLPVFSVDVSVIDVSDPDAGLMLPESVIDPLPAAFGVVVTATVLLAAVAMLVTVALPVLFQMTFPPAVIVAEAFPVLVSVTAALLLDESVVAAVFAEMALVPEPAAPAV